MVACCHLDTVRCPACAPHYHCVAVRPPQWPLFFVDVRRPIEPGHTITRTSNASAWIS